MKSILFLILNLFILPLLLTAQNFNDALRLSESGILSNARALGMGNSYHALSSDYGATIFNPAGLGFIKKINFTGSINHNINDNSSSFFNTSDSYSQNSTTLSQFGIILPVPVQKGSLVFATGFSRTKDFNKGERFDGFNPGNNSMIQDLTAVNDDIPYELRLSYPLFDQADNYLKDTTHINGMLNQLGEIIQEGSVNKWSFSGAFEAAENVFIGATFNSIYGEFRSDREYREEDTRNNYGSEVLTDPAEQESADFQSFYFHDNIIQDLSGWEVKLGLLYKAHSNVNLGASIKFPTFYTIREEYAVNGESEFGTGKIYNLDPDAFFSEIQYEISTPFEFTGSASVKIMNFILSGEATFIDYSQMKFSDGFDAENRSLKNKDIKNLFGSKLNFNVGGEYTIPYTPVNLRAGFIYKPSPYVDDPSDFHKKYLTAGVGVLFGGSILIDVGYAYGWWKDFGDNYGSNLSRVNQDIKVNNSRFYHHIYVTREPTFGNKQEFV